MSKAKDRKRAAEGQLHRSDQTKIIRCLVPGCNNACSQQEEGKPSICPSCYKLWQAFVFFQTHTAYEKGVTRGGIHIPGQETIAKLKEGGFRP